MKIMPVKQATYEQLEKFIQKNENIEGRLLSDKGYVVEINGEIEASFALEELPSGELWLKKLFITQSHAAKLPVLLETILQIAKKKEAETVYVHSHQPVVDILLESLEFQPEDKEEIKLLKPDLPGSWWSYHIS